ncbi:outer membrane beta-barrel protein [Sphingomonas flavalba]|uniref:outer membrane beta-barrel protein n=1 Tax=Sphingomonas flavalba TaxID=2559804 RepID=UPI0039E19060
MSKPLSLARLLFASTAIVAPPAFAQVGQPTTLALAAAPEPAAAPAAPAEGPPGSVDISVPGGADNDIVVTGRANVDVLQASPQVISVLSNLDIARTGEGDIAGALQRVTGLSVVGSGFVYVRGLGDRYSLALLNGSPLPSPEPLKRVVPLDIFPTEVIASSLVQKSYSANFPGEFGGGVINLTTIATPDEPFFKVSGSLSGNSETTGQLGYTYYGSATDWTGFDDGARAMPRRFAAALASGNPIMEGADFSKADLGLIASSLANANTTLLQKNDSIPVNFSVDLSGGGSFAIGDATLGVIAAAGISNKWQTRQTLQQLSLDADLSGTQTSYNHVITDNRVVVNGLVGFGLDFGDNRIRWTNLYIRDTLKQADLSTGTDANQQGRDILKQGTAWYERQLINTQLVGAFTLGDVNLDLRGGYANSQREAPYERSFTYVRTNQAADPTGAKFVNDLGGNKGDASVAFSDLDENLYSGGIDLGYRISPALKLGAGYAYSDTARTSVRRAFQYRAAGLPVSVQQLRPDYLLSDYTIQTYGITLLETTASDGTAAFDAGLTVHAGYGQVIAQVLPTVNITAGVRYERGLQTVEAVDLFGTGLGTAFNTRLKKDYWLPALTATIDVAPQMQLRFNGSRTLARPQFRELIRQVYIDTDSNRTFQGNPSLVDSTLWNAEARYEWFFAPEQRVTFAGFYKKLDNPIEAYSSIFSSDITTSFANAPKADLYGIEIEAQKHIDLSRWSDSDFFASRRLILIGNYTYTQSKLKVGAGDVTVINGVVQPALNFFHDGAPMTGQSDHLVNLQIGLEDTDRLSQQTLLLSYASDRVTTRGPSGQPDVRERPGLRLDFVARQGVSLFGVEAEMKFEARNITNQKYREFQQAGANRIYYNRYIPGMSFSVGIGVKL